MMKIKVFKPFEILTACGNRFRCETPGYRWQYALIPGSPDVEDKTIVELIRIDEEEGDEVVKTISSVIAAGYVADDVLLRMPREKLTKQCPQCGYVEEKKENKK